ncbi:MAG: hypothetical protein GY801_36015 [bacterium]|nr:hypothetical protein [bacterium]
MKLYEFTGYRKYSVVVAAEDEETAVKTAKDFRDEWLGACGADEIGFEELDIDDILDVRDVPPDAKLNDVAHYVVA